MDLPVIEVSGEEAAAKLAEYERLDPAARSPLDAAIARAYRAVRRGGQVIRLSEAIRAGGFDEHGLPRLAVGGSCWERVTCAWVGGWGTSDLLFTDHPARENRGAAVGRCSVRVAFPDGTRPSSGRLRSATAIMPLIPPDCRPARGLARCHVLFEAEWDLTAPRDPALIRHVWGDLWRVLSTWDLTELERAVLGPR